MFYHARVEKDATAVEDLFEEMLRNDLRPNAYHTAALIEAYCNTRQIERARQTLFTASVDGVRVNRVLYTLLIQAYGNEGDPDMGREIYCRMLADRVVPDIASLEVLVRGYFMVQRYAEAKETLLEFWPTVLPFRSRPLPFVSLSGGLRILREMEWHAKRPPPTKGRLTGLFVKEITKQWQRTVKKSKLREISPVVKKLKRAIAAAEVVEEKVED
jgi:pentatricopeptide repeat protein